MSTTKERLWTSSFWAACGANFLMFFAFYMLLPVLPIYLAERFSATESAAGLILASYTVMALLFRPFAGFMVDSWPRKMVLMGCYAFFISFFGGYLLAGALLIFALLRAMHGLAFGMVTVSVNTMAIDVMPASRRGEGIGYFGVSTNLAMAIGPMSALLIYDLTQNYDLIFGAACLVGVLGLISAGMIRGGKQEAVGARRTLSLDRFLLIPGIPTALTTMLLSFVYGVVVTYVAVYGEKEVGLAGGTGHFFICMACGLIVSRLLSGRLVNRGLIRQVAVAGIGVILLSGVAFVLIKHPVSFYACGVTFGLGYGLLCPALQTMFINLAEHNQRGTANATYLTSWDVGIGAGVLLGGVIAQHGSYGAAFLVGTGLLFAGGLVFVLWSGPYFERHRLR